MDFSVAACQSADTFCHAGDMAAFRHQNPDPNGPESGQEKAARTFVARCFLVLVDWGSDAAEKISQNKNTRKPDHCAGGNAPAGFLCGVVHINSD